jgi:hypothetical protein
MKEHHGSYFKEEFIHANTRDDAGNQFGTQFLPGNATWNITESTIQAEILYILNRDLRADDFTNSVDGIDDCLVNEIISKVRDIEE